MIQPPGGLFTQAGDPAPFYWVDDLHNLRLFIESYFDALGCESGISYLDLGRAESASEKILWSNASMENPSVFKIAAAFTAGFMYASPIKTVLGPEKFGPDLDRVGRIENHENAVIAFEYSRACLLGAEYQCSGNQVCLEKEIKVSPHTYADIIRAITTFPANPSSVVEPSSVHLMALLYETLAYQANEEECCDPRTV